VITTSLIRAAEYHRQDLLTEAAQARLVASARPTRASRPALQPLSFFARSVRLALAAFSTVAF
jgi:hypothetical protein